MLVSEFGVVLKVHQHGAPDVFHSATAKVPRAGGVK